MKIDTDTITITRKELKDAMLDVTSAMADDYMEKGNGSSMGGLALIAMGASLAARLDTKLFDAEDEVEKPEKPELKFGDE